MPRKRPRPGAAPEQDDEKKNEQSSRKNVSGSGSRSAFTEMRRRAREVPSSDPPGRLDEPQRPEDKGAQGRNFAIRKPAGKR